MVANNPHMPPPKNPHQPKGTENMKADAGTNYDKELSAELAALAARATMVEKRRQMVSDVDSLFRTISENLVMIIVGERATDRQKSAATNVVLGMMFDCYEKASQFVLMGWCEWSYVTITARLQECTSDIVRRFHTGTGAVDYSTNVTRAIGQLRDIFCEIGNKRV